MAEPCLLPDYTGYPGKTSSTGAANIIIILMRELKNLLSFEIARTSNDEISTKE